MRMKTIHFFRCCAVIIVATVFTACTEFISDNNTGIGESLGLPGCVNVMNENLANSKSRTGSSLIAPAIHTSAVSGSDKPVSLRYTTTPGIQLRQDSNAAKTRGTLITTDKIYDSYCLYTYLYQNSDTWAAISSTTSTSYSDEQVLKARSWSTAEFWPGVGAKCAFFAYAPYHSVGLSAFTNIGWPTFHYTVPVIATAENDLLVTRNDISSGLGDYGNIDVPGNFNAKDYITFDHACTAIRFAIGNQMAPCTIKKIEIKNVYGEGDYQYQTESWANLSTLTTFNLTKDITVKATDSNVILNNDDDVFLMIPQKVPANATIAVTINDGVDHVLTARIDNDNWLKGYTVTYYLSTTEVNTKYVLSVSPASNTISSSGGTDVLTINSYKQTYYGSQVAVPWTATYTYDENGDKGTTVYNSTNATITGFTASSNGSISGEKVNFSVVSTSSSLTKPAYRSKIENSTHTKNLREAADGSCDLADGKQTANCYVIHAPGHYKFPLVYGNALNSDKTYNTDSYGTTTFVDHQGVKIDNPYIYLTNNSANVTYDACIVWQDAPHLITPSSLKLSSDNHSIEFDVERDNICQGNSVIAVRDKNGVTMWSWHIWVTDYPLTNTYEVHNNPNVGGAVISYFMEVPLGYCDADVRVCDEFRRFYITIKQTDTDGETGAVTLPQYVGQYTYGPNAPYYQWGRKDPMLPSNGLGTTAKPYYDNQYVPLVTMASSAIKDGIMRPNMFNNSYNSSYELWNKGNTVTTVNNNTIHKTIYSPSPTGYLEPKTAAFTGFSISGGNGAWPSGNIMGGYKQGYTFYCQPNAIGGTVFFNAFGMMSGGTYSTLPCYYSAAGPADGNYGRYLGFDTTNIFPQDTRSCVEAHSMRPVLK